MKYFKHLLSVPVLLAFSYICLAQAAPPNHPNAFENRARQPLFSTQQQQYGQQMPNRFSQQEQRSPSASSPAMNRGRGGWVRDPSMQQRRPSSRPYQERNFARPQPQRQYGTMHPPRRGFDGDRRHYSSPSPRYDSRDRGHHYPPPRSYDRYGRHMPPPSPRYDSRDRGHHYPSPRSYDRYGRHMPPPQPHRYGRYRGYPPPPPPPKMSKHEQRLNYFRDFFGI